MFTKLIKICGNEKNICDIPIPIRGFSQEFLNIMIIYKEDSFYISNLRA